MIILMSIQTKNHRYGFVSLIFLTLTLLHEENESYMESYSTDSLMSGQPQSLNGN